MTVDLASIENLKEIFELVEACKSSMQEQLILQWTPSYPSIEIIKEDIECESLFTIKEDQIILGTIVMNTVEDVQYSKINWLDMAGRPLIVHRLAVHPSHQRKGIASRLMDYGESYAKLNRYTSIRLDAFNGNPFALKLYQKRMYQKRGELYFRNPFIPFSCFEKRIN